VIEYIRNHAIGSAVPGINLGILKGLPVVLPPLPAQRTIAAILSAYDDLIENNNRRMRVLEEMAQRIYREWFVDFRYPGHENVPLVDSELGPIPKGWDVANVARLVTRVQPGSVLTGESVQSMGTVPIIDQSRAVIAGFHDGAPGITASVDDPAILFGDHTCKMEAVIEPFSVGPNVVVFRPTVPIPTLLLVRLLSGLVHTQEYKRHWTSLCAKLVIVPPSALGKRFVEAVQDGHLLAKTLRDSKRTLQLTRDVLLPRLLSAEIEVTDLHIALPDLVA
jgi:type I restriction enzyme S subunit